MPIETKYARSGDVNIAYQVVGHGPLDLVLVMGWVSHLDYFWEEPRFARFLRRLASFSRLILFDKRGTGLSDRVAGAASLEQRMDDVRAVMDAVGSSRAALIGISEGAPLCTLFAATYPERTIALVTVGGFARRLVATDYPWGATPEDWQAYLDRIVPDWGGPVGLEARAPSVAHDERFRQWWATYLRMGASPGAALAYTRMNAEIDVRHVLPAVRVPTLVIHRTDDRTIPAGAARYMAAQIPGARYLELPGVDHLPFVGDQEPMLDEIETFLTGARPAGETDRVLATLLSAEIVGAAAEAARRGSQHWHQLRIAYDEVIQNELTRYRGHAIRVTGESVIAAFDGPARAIRCATALGEGAQLLGLELRAGLHHGECEVIGDDLAGTAVELAARVMSHAHPGDILVSSMVKDLVAGAGLEFAPVDSQGALDLPGEGRLFRAIHGGQAESPTALVQLKPAERSRTGAGHP